MQFTVRKTLSYIESLIVLLALSYVVSRFYLPGTHRIFSSFQFSWPYIRSILFLSVITDGLFILLHLPRRHVKHTKLSFEPEKVTVLIACYNGENVIGETIEHALMKVPRQNIIVASDASTDNTVAIARSYGVRVLDYKVNMNKAFTINRAIHEVTTPYVLLLDDDTLIGATTIPTNLLDEGYSAVSFNVIPVKTDALINRYQLFEYRKSMLFSKSLRANVGAVGNVSGAIGLYHTKDLVTQDGHHSGQYGGEDQQRTMLIHILTDGKGVTFTNSPVYTKVPNTFKALTKQRSKSWNLSVQELFWINVRIILNPKVNYILKVDRAYQMYIVLTDPMRMTLFAFFMFHPITILFGYIFYSFLGILSWLKIGRKDPIWVVLTFPIYSKYLFFCRLHASFHWYKVKYLYVKRNLHKHVKRRNLIYEYAGTGLIFITIWSLTVLIILQTLNFKI